MDPLRAASETAVSALYAQSLRMRLVAENMANAESTGRSAGADPYRRRMVAFANELDRVTGVDRVATDGISSDHSPFRMEQIPGHPAADSNGYVKLPNVNMIIEMADMRQAVRSYEANLQVMKQSGEMQSSLVDLLRSSG